MSAPVLTVFTDAAPCPRVEVFFPSFDAGTVSVTVFRISGGREFQVRGAVRAATAGSLSRIDFEVPFNEAVSYRAEQFDAAGVSLGFTPTTTLGDLYTAWVEQAQNRAVDPRGATAASWTATSSAGTPTRTALSFPNNIGGFGVDSFIRAETTSASTYVDLRAGTSTSPDDALKGATVPVSVWGRLSGFTSVSSVRLHIQQFNAASTLLQTTDSPVFAPPVQGDWSSFSVDSVVLHADTVRVVVILRASGVIPVAGRLDASVISIGASPYIDGSLGGGGLERYRWLGSANNSASVRETRAYLGFGVPSAGSWMHNPLDPQGSVQVFFGDDSSWKVTRPTPGVVSHPKGRRVGVVLSEPRQGVTGVQLTVRTSNDADADKVQVMCGDNGMPPVLCIRLGSDDKRLRIPKPLFLSALVVAEVDMNTRWGGTELAHMVDGDEVSPPIPGLFVPLLTRADLNAFFATRAALNAGGLTRSDINRRYDLAGTAG